MELADVEDIQSLVRKARAHDADMVQRHEAFGEIVKRFQDMACGCAYSVLGDFHLAENAAQEAFIEGYRSIDKLKEPKAFAGWFRRLCMWQHTTATRRAWNCYSQTAQRLTPETRTAGCRCTTWSRSVSDQKWRNCCSRTALISMPRITWGQPRRHWLCITR